MANPIPMLLAALALPAALLAQQPLSVSEALALKQIANPCMGDGFVVCNVVVPRPIADGPGGSYLNLAVVEGGKLRMLVDGKRSAGSIAVRPGARQVSFKGRADGRTQVLTMDLDSGEVDLFAATPSVASYRWRPDGGAIAFTSQDPLPEGRAAARERGFRPVVVDEDWQHLSLWVCERGGEPKRLTEGVTVFDFQWSPDGTQLAAAIAPRNTVDDSYMAKRLHLVDAASGKRRKLVDNPGKLGDFAFSADGRRLAYVSAADRNDPHAGSLYLLDVEAGEARALSHGFLGMVQHVQPMAGGFLVQESLGVRTRLRGVDAEGKHLWIHEPRKQRLAITGMSSHGDDFVYTASHAEHPAELFAPLPDDGSGDDRAERWTDVNPALAEHTFGEQRVVRIRTSDGVTVEGLLVLPIGYQQGRRYPLVIVAHGGPESHYSDGWLTTYSQWGHLLAARGIVSWYPNYRSSTGYGVAFCKHDHGDPMGKEFQDHLDAIEHFVGQGLVDRARVGVGGGSYGGYTAAWAATRHSDRFAAAVSFVPFVDIRTKWLTSDIPMEFYYVHYQEKWPWQQPGLLADRSPLTWADRCTTPTLLLGGTSDPRVHPSQPFMLYRAIKFATDAKVRYVQYDGEGHGNRVNVNRMDYCLRALRWFEHYLTGDGDRRRKALPPLDVAYPE
ncbi:MAG: S9 family peptidase [Planctomycetes bacterium]|nr:S9 family peptidase [Planctomycetota bacterium]